MTRDEFYEKYGDIEVAFSSYYKFIFSYTGTTPSGASITVNCGGNADDIYRLEVLSSSTGKVLDMLPYAGRVVGDDGNTIDEFYDY